jgi:DNA-binding PadR family transcriptional regulator
MRIYMGGGRDCGPRHGGGWGGRGPFGFGFDMGGGEGREGGRSRRKFDGGELRLILLKLIADQTRHGYELIRAIEDMTGGAYAPSPGVVYPTLTMLDEMGLIDEQQSDDNKKRFAVTDAGRSHLADRQDEVDALIARLEQLKPAAFAEGGSPVWRAMRNLGVAIRHRVERGDLTSDTVHDVAALIDEVAQKIERLR